LAQLAAAFDADLPPAADEPDEPRDVTRRIVGSAHLRVIVAVGTAAAVLLAWFLLAQRPETAEPIAEVGFAEQPSSGPTAGEELVVDVIGKVKRPGIVTVPSGSRVYEAVEAAGGVSNSKVDTSGLNMARLLEDGEQIVVGEPPESAPDGAGTGKINLNRASVDELDTLPGVGPVTAQSIVDWRAEHGRFRSVDDLLDVTGIGEKTLADLRDLVTV